MDSLDRIAKLFARAKEENRATFVGYVCACDPDFDTSLAICRALLENGVDLLELGVFKSEFASTKAIGSGARKLRAARA